MRNKHGFRLKVFGLFVFLSFVYLCPAYSAQYPHYEIIATIDARQKTIHAKETVTFTNNSQDVLHEVYFHIYPNRTYTPREKQFMLSYAAYFKVDPFPEGFPADLMKIERATAQNKEVPFEIEGEDLTLLKIPLGPGLNPKEQAKVTIEFSVKIPHAYGRFGWNENIMALSRWYPILSVYNEKGWNNHPFYPFHRPFFSEASNYSVELTVPQDQVVIHTGYLKNEQASGDRKTLFLETSLPVREFTMSMSPDYAVQRANFRDVRINSFYLPGDEIRGEEALENAKDLMAFYTDLFGEYAYKEFSIAPVFLGYGGEQMSNMIFIDTRVYKLPKLLKRHFDFLISHETGHQWFYNMVGIDEFSQIWLEEGVNSYFILQYLEDKYGYDADIVEMPRYLDWFLPNASFRRTRDYRYKILARTKLNYPVENKLSSYTEPSSIFSITYGKGSAIVSMVKYMIGEEAFLRVFSRIFGEYRFRNLGTQDFIRICEEESGKELKTFFDQWLHTTKNFDYAVNAVKGSTVFLENRGGIVMPADVEVHFADGGIERFIWEGTPAKEKIVLKGKGHIKKVKINPGEELLDIDRTNNQWPRKIFVKPVPIYLGLYDIALFLPEDSYNFVFGPDFSGGLGVKMSLQKPFDQGFYAATNYEFGEDLQKSRLGYELKNVFRKRATLGFELFNVTDYDNGEDDLVGGKVYIRKEIRPVAYSLTSINDHITLYLIRNQGLNKNSSVLYGKEDSRNVSYLKKDEAIVGTSIHLERSVPVLNPSQGFRIDSFFESSGHFLGATQYFNRGALDLGMYRGVTKNSQVSLRLKYAGGYPKDKNLFELGGADGLRGYDRKTVRGSSAVLGSLEYRFPILKKMDVRLFDNIVSFDSVGGVVFFDSGQSWYTDFDESSLKKDAGFGLRFTVTIGSFLEQVMLRFDAAQAINDSSEKTRFWFGIGHAF